MTSYRSAGVDLDAADEHVRSIAAEVTSTWNESVVGVFGGFAAGVTIPPGFDEPVLMMSTDGVGTKLEVARRTGIWDGVGFDLVAMCVDDLAVVGARPIGFVDYMAVGALDSSRDRTIVASIAKACLAAGCPLLGGETAEHPGIMRSDEVDLAGAVIGVVERRSIPSTQNVEKGQVLIGLSSPNLRSNGFSLVRNLLGDEIEDLGPALMEPSVIYSSSVLEAMSTGLVTSAVHVTGGGIPGNLRRSIPPGVGARVDLASWRPPQIFAKIASSGVGDADMYATFNMGIGFVLIVRPNGVEEILGATRGHAPTVIGEITGDVGTVSLV